MQIYDITNSAIALGLIGLVQFAAPLLLTFVAGEVADRYDRRAIVRVCYVVQTVVTTGLLLLTLLPELLRPIAEYRMILYSLLLVLLMLLRPQGLFQLPGRRARG